MERRDATDSDTLTRRQLLGEAALVAAGSAGCLGHQTTGDGTGTTTERAVGNSETTSGRDPPRVVSVSVADFIEYPLAGVHPHVYSREDTQYVVVHLERLGESDIRRIRENLTVTLGEPTLPRAARQPVSWDETVDVAFAVSKGRTVEQGAVRYEGEVLQPLDSSTLNRLNNPPVFTVSDLRVSPAELDAGEQVEASVQFTLSNTGEGDGTFGASLTGNYSSGSTTVTATLDPGTERTVTGAVEVIGRGETAEVRVDWGSGERRVGIPVVGEVTTTGTETPLPTPR